MNNSLYSADFVYSLLDEATRPAFNSWLQMMAIYSAGKVETVNGVVVLDRPAAEYEIAAYNWVGTEVYDAAMAALDGHSVITEADLAYQQQVEEAIGALETSLEADLAMWEPDDEVQVAINEGLDSAIEAAQEAREAWQEQLAAMGTRMAAEGVEAVARAPAAVLFNRVVSFDPEYDVPRMERGDVEWILGQVRGFGLGSVAVGVLRSGGSSVPVLVCGAEEAVGQALALWRVEQLVHGIEAELEAMQRWEEALGRGV